MNDIVKSTKHITVYIYKSTKYTKEIITYLKIKLIKKIFINFISHY